MKNLAALYPVPCRKRFHLYKVETIRLFIALSLKTRCITDLKKRKKNRKKVRKLHFFITLSDKGHGNESIKFQDIDEEWKINGIAMQQLQNCTPPIFMLRWRARLMLSLKTQMEFVQACRMDYVTDLMALIVFFNFLIISNGAPPPVQ